MGANAPGWVICTDHPQSARQGASGGRDVRAGPVHTRQGPGYGLSWGALAFIAAWDGAACAVWRDSAIAKLGNVRDTGGAGRQPDEGVRTV